ncbi:MAG TPA: type III pantothenate kinase [Candidatus Dojkabacteria bacterium]
MYKIVIDIGNTNIVFGFFLGDELKSSSRVATERKKSEDEYALYFTNLLELNNIEKEKVSSVIISSVVPSLDEKFKEVVVESLSMEPLMVSENYSSIPIKINIDNPEQLGSDRLVNSYQVHKDLRSENIIIVDFGTATTFDIVLQNGSYEGGIIAPGIGLSLKALSDAAEKLPEISFARVEKVVGKNTIDAMNSGVYWGYVYLVKGLIKAIKKEYPNREFKVILTGGLSPLIKKDISEADEVDINLTLRGLNSILKLNM